MSRLVRVQHTCVRLDGPAGSLVIDPALDYHGSMWSPDGRPEEAGALLRDVDGVLITHAHSDHFHPPTLLHFKSDIRIVVPAADSASPYPMIDELADFGFSNVVAIDHGESVAVAGMTAWAFNAPASVEMLPQMAYLIENDGRRILHAADALEDFLTDELLAAAEGCDVALLPMNASLHVANLRNQMSPATFARAVERLKARIVVPLGTNEGERRPANPLAAPWFPFGDAHLESPGFRRLVAPGSLVRLRDGEVMALDGSGVAPATAASAQDTAVEKALGQMWALLADVHRRSRAAFGLNVELSFDRWRDAWCTATAVLTEGLASGASTIDESVGRVPLKHATSPAARIFPRSLAPAERQYPGTHARALWTIEPDVDERTFAQAVYDLLSREAMDDNQRRLALLEFVAYLQRQHHRTRPPHPSPWSEEQRRRWWRRQAESDASAAEFVYPAFNPIFGPFGRNGGTSFLVSTLHNGLRLRRHRVPDRHRSWVTAIREGAGRRTLSDLMGKEGLTADRYVEFACWIGDVEPYALDNHWLAGHSWVWQPAFESDDL